jgi:hypothetical protein
MNNADTIQYTYKNAVIRHLDFSTNAKETVFDIQFLQNDYKKSLCARYG